MAEVKEPGPVRNARRRYQERRAAARTTRDLLAAAADYFRGAFSKLPAEQARAVADRLVEHTDGERRRVHDGD